MRAQGGDHGEDHNGGDEVCAVHIDARAGQANGHNAQVTDHIQAAGNGGLLGSADERLGAAAGRRAGTDAAGRAAGSRWPATK